MKRCYQCDSIVNVDTEFTNCPNCDAHIHASRVRFERLQREKLRNAPADADAALNGAYRAILSGSIVTISAREDFWEWRTITYPNGDRHNYPNLNVSHMISSGLLERAETDTREERNARIAELDSLIRDCRTHSV